MATLTRQRRPDGGTQTRFIRELRHLMLDRDINSAGELYDLMVRAKLRGPNGATPAKATIYSYFRGTNDPQPWFMRAVREAFRDHGMPLSDEEWRRLSDAYFESY